MSNSRKRGKWLPLGNQLPLFYYVDERRKYKHEQFHVLRSGEQGEIP